MTTARERIQKMADFAQFLEDSVKITGREQGRNREQVGMEQGAEPGMCKPGVCSDYADSYSNNVLRWTNRQSVSTGSLLRWPGGPVLV